MCVPVVCSLLMEFSVKYLTWSKSAGAFLTSVYWISLTGMRGASIYISKIVSAKIIIICDLIFAILSFIPLLFWVKSHICVLWVCSIGIGVSIASLFSSGITWVENYLCVSEGVGAIFMIGDAVGEMIGPIIVGYMFETISPMWFVYIIFACVCLCSVVFIAMCLVIEVYGQIASFKCHSNLGNIRDKTDTRSSPTYTGD